MSVSTAQTCRRSAVLVASMLALTCGAGVSAAAGGVTRAVAAPSASTAPKLSEIELDSTHDIKVISTTKRKLLLGYSSDHQSAAMTVDDSHARPDDDLINASGINIFVSTRGASGESHHWYFPAPKTRLTYTAAGRGKVSATSLSKYGRVHLTMAAAGTPKIRTCDDQDFTVIRPVSVRGTLLLNTHSTGKHRWGTVGSTRFVASHGWEVTEDYGNGCYRSVPENPRCVSEIGWVSTYDQTRTYFYGETATIHGKHEGLVAGERYTDLAAPHGAVRYDRIEAVSPAPALAQRSDGSEVLTIRTRGRVATGSATMTTTPMATDRPHDGFACETASGQSGTETYDNELATFVGGGVGLAVVGQVFGTIRASATSQGSIDHDSYELVAPQ